VLEVFKNKPIDVKELMFTNKESIKELDNEFDYSYYIPPFEYQKTEQGGIEWNLIDEMNYTKSKELVGQLNDIIVAVCPDDPYKNDMNSIYRIHGRIVDGRTRYLSRLNENNRWKIKYVRVLDFERFIFIWSHYNSLKGGNKKDEKNKFLQVCKYLHEVKGLEKSKCGALIIAKFGNNNPFPKTRMYDILEPEYKITYSDKEHKSSDQTTDKKSKKRFKKDKKIDQLHIEINDLVTQNFNLQENNKQLEEKLEGWEDKEPFLNAEHELKINGSKDKVKIKIDLENKKVDLI